ncbi:GDSL esterase/lipase At5g62930-like isoform X1 [Macadamia integrifolia]|uniref:GDSL esterase/lipase At5g62930-like isoform X1 n=1 Tax=Macadamia integrifolia TaxID=60698 RepID=UPI001C500CD0|nr:GDSL esterase/lipase At5g62930-like isoform X1 [Macadamia integrifolia]
MSWFVDMVDTTLDGLCSFYISFFLSYFFPLFHENPHLSFPVLTFDCANPPVATTVFFGANDAVLLGRNNERQHVPVEEYKENLRRMVHHLKKCSPTMLVVLITPPPVDEEGRLEYARSVFGDKAVKLPERTNEMAGIYAKQCVELAKELGLPSIDLWSKIQEAEEWRKKFLSDGLHLTEEGNALVHHEVVGVFDEASLYASAMPHDFPHHSEIDWKNPSKAFQLQCAQQQTSALSQLNEVCYMDP